MQIKLAMCLWLFGTLSFSDSLTVRVKHSNLVSFNSEVDCEETSSKIFRGRYTLTVKLAQNLELSNTLFTCRKNAVCINGGSYASCTGAKNAATELGSEKLDSLIRTFDAISNDDTIVSTSPSGEKICSKYEVSLLRNPKPNELTFSRWKLIKQQVECN